MTATVANQVDVAHVLLEHDCQAMQRVTERGAATKGKEEEEEAAYVALAQGINAVDHDNATALRLASEKGHVGMVRLLLEHGARTVVDKNLIGQCCKEQSDALMVACMAGHEEVVGLLLAREGEEMTFDRLNLLIRRTCEAGQDAVVVMLAGTSVGACKWKWRQLRQAMKSAARLGRVGLLHQLLPLTAQEDVNATMEVLSHALWEAVQEGHMEAAKLLLHHGADTWLTGEGHDAVSMIQTLNDMEEALPHRVAFVNLLEVRYTGFEFPRSSLCP
jgi:ankyrin repeat protein